MMELPSSERIHVYRLPRVLNQGYCFGGGNPVTFQNVDWFDTPDKNFSPPMTLVELVDFISKKNYAHRGESYLILGETFAHRVTL
jgi:hypothetical protein